MSRLGANIFYCLTCTNLVDSFPSYWVSTPPREFYPSILKMDKRRAKIKADISAHLFGVKYSKELGRLIYKN